MQPTNPCPKWDRCAAPYCPMDPHRAEATTLRDEPSCLYLREAVKPDGRVPAAMRGPVADALPLVIAGTEGGYALRKALERAARHGSSRRRTTSL